MANYSFSNFFKSIGSTFKPSATPLYNPLAQKPKTMVPAAPVSGPIIPPIPSIPTTGGDSLMAINTPPQFSASAIPQVKAPVVPTVPAITPTLPPKTPVLPTITPTPTIMPASDTSTTTTPTLPAVSPATQTAYNAANKAVEESLKISPDELSTQADIDKLIESTKAGYRATSDQPIPMEFITGQLASIERRATGLAEPLERKLSRLQAARTASLEASKFKLERTADQLKIEREASQKAKEEAESARRFGITTGLTEKTQAQSKLEADRKFEEDKRQFGLDYAIKQREIAVKERETAIKETEAKGATGVTPEAGSALQLISEILPNAKAVSGAFQTGMIPFTAGKVTKNKLNQLNAILAIGARKLIKGQGQVSDYEAKILQQSTNALSSGLSESAFAEELKRMRGILNANAGFPVMVQIVQNGKVVDEGTLSREDIFDAASKGYQIKYQ